MCMRSGWWSYRCVSTFEVSSGILKHETQVLTGLTPFHPSRDAEIAFRVLQGHRPTKPANASDVGISEGLWQLLVRCWNVNDTKRPRVDEIYEHLCQEPARGRSFPPSNVPRAPSCENSLVSGTHQHGNSTRFELVPSRAYPSTDEIFRSAISEIVQTPTEGKLSATS